MVPPRGSRAAGIWPARIIVPMAEGSNDLEPLKFREAFPLGNLAGDWVMVLSMAMNDLATLDGKIHDALDSDDPGASYFFRLLCGTLREIWQLFQVADEEREVQKLIDGLVDGAREPYDEVRELFVRPEPTDEEPDPRSWAELHLKDVRDRTFHYPKVGGDELREALEGASDEEARFLSESSRPFQYADVAAIRVSFGDINEEEDRKSFEEVITTTKRILQLVIPVVWNALGVHVRALGFEPRRLEAPEAGDDGSVDDGGGTEAV